MPLLQRYYTATSAIQIAQHAALRNLDAIIFTFKRRTTFCLQLPQRLMEVDELF